MQVSPRFGARHSINDSVFGIYGKSAYERFENDVNRQMERLAFDTEDRIEIGFAPEGKIFKGFRSRPANQPWFMSGDSYSDRIDARIIVHTDKGAVEKEVSNSNRGKSFWNKTYNNRPLPQKAVDEAVKMADFYGLK